MRISPVHLLFVAPLLLGSAAPSPPAEPAPRATPRTLWPTQAERCQYAWNHMTERQKQLEGSADAFLARCQRQPLVALCTNGWIEYGSRYGDCRDHGGLRSYIVMPDG